MSVTFPAVDKGDQALGGFQYSASSVAFGSTTDSQRHRAQRRVLTTMSYSATPDSGMQRWMRRAGALTLAGAGTCVVTATAAASDDYNEATAGYTVTVQAGRRAGAEPRRRLAVTIL